MQQFQTMDDLGLAEALRSGAIGVLPTDTLYGLACRAADQAAVARLYELKVPESKPGTVIAANVDQLVQLGLKRRYVQAVAAVWPGPISVIIPCGPELEYLDQGLRGLAVRLPAAAQLVALLEAVGPLLTSSANLPGQAPATNVTEAMRYFGEAVDFYLDGGDYADRAASTLIRVVDDAVEVLREGAVSAAEVDKLLAG